MATARAHPQRTHGDGARRRFIVQRLAHRDDHCRKRPHRAQPEDWQRHLRHGAEDLDQARRRGETDRAKQLAERGPRLPVRIQPAADLHDEQCPCGPRDERQRREPDEGLEAGALRSAGADTRRKTREHDHGDGFAASRWIGLDFFVEGTIEGGGTRQPVGEDDHAELVHAAPPHTHSNRCAAQRARSVYGSSRVRTRVPQAQKRLFLEESRARPGIGHRSSGAVGCGNFHEGGEFPGALPGGSHSPAGHLRWIDSRCTTSASMRFLIIASSCPSVTLRTSPQIGMSADPWPGTRRRPSIAAYTSARLN